MSRIGKFYKTEEKVMLIMKAIDEWTEKQKEKHEGESALVLERLELLRKCCQERIHSYKIEMEQQKLEDQEKEVSYSIVGRPISYISQYHINIHDGINQEIEDAIGDLFSFKTESLKQALSVMVKSTLKELIVSATVGEDAAEAFYIVPYNNAIVRVDFRAWKYNFVSQGVIGDTRNAFCYIASKSIIDYHKLTSSELIYFVSDQLSTALGHEANLEMVKEYIQKLQTIWDLVENKSVKTVLNEALKEPLLQNEQSWRKEN